MSQQKAAEPLAQLPVNDLHVLAGAAEIAHRLLLGAGNPDRSQLSGAVQSRQTDRIASIGLDPFAGLARNQRRRDDHAAVSGGSDPPVQCVTARAGLVAKARLPLAAAVPLQQPPHRLGRVGNLAAVAHLASALRRYSDSDRLLVDIQFDVLAKLRHDLSSSMRLCASAGPPAA